MNGSEARGIVETVAELAASSGLRIVASQVLPARPERMMPPPATLDEGVRELLTRQYPFGLFAHQSMALNAVLSGEDVCLATSTASGKSLVFMAAAAHLLREDRRARVAVFYPVKALIQDQKQKWSELLSPLGLSTGYIDGGVPRDQRGAILRNHRVVLMTPDVAHAWLLGNVATQDASAFLTSLRMLILDETHVFDGVFGTNMAYFIRRLRALSPIETIISSTATLGDPESFIEKLTGRRPRLLSEPEDGAPRPKKSILLAEPVRTRAFEAMVELLSALAAANVSRFLAFADSRKMVEQLVAATMRAGGGEVPEDESVVEDLAPSPDPHPILPYRAGYEEEDRQEIQRALEGGQLSGVVSTSAMELGLDIGHIDIVLLLGTPPSLKSFWQRVGRAGRRRPGVCLLVDDRSSITLHPGGLEAYLARSPESGWLYLENKYLQFANALCAAQEASEWGKDRYDSSVFGSAPGTFLRFLENELDPTENIAEDLYHLKQRAQGGPHFEFPLRSGVEKSFGVKELRRVGVRSLGTLSYSQALREAYPGGIYYYMARAKRVVELRYRAGEIVVRGERRWTTQPVSQNMVFPMFEGGTLDLFTSEDGFVCEAEMQVSERVLGFVESRGPNRITNMYGTGSPYSQRPLQNFLETTGVCWYSDDRRVLTDGVAEAVRQAFGALCGIELKDVGHGVFHARVSPTDHGECRGMCIYDATSGSLRLTQQLLERYPEVTELAIAIARNADPANEELVAGLIRLHVMVSRMVRAPRDVGSGEIGQPGPAVVGDWAVVVAPGQSAMLGADHEPQEVVVKGYRYTPHGLMYELQHTDARQLWMVPVGSVNPIHGMTKLIHVNLVTGEEKAME